MYLSQEMDAKYPENTSVWTFATATKNMLCGKSKKPKKSFLSEQKGKVI